MTQFYSYPKDEYDPWKLPDAEAFYVGANSDWEDEEGEPLEPGWYYQFCFPGCLPESDPVGPYETEEKAIKACRNLACC